MADLPDGVPNLLDVEDVVFLAPGTLLTGDGFFGYGSGASPLWGIFQNGVPVVLADTVTSFGYKQDWAIADYPVERGGFESYDKVNTPFRIHIQFVSGGSEANRETLLSSVAAIGDQLTLYDVLTPEAVYIGTNVEGYSYRRSSNNGLGLMIVDVAMIEIREEGITNSFQNTASPSGFLAAPTGQVQSPSITQNLGEVQ